MIGEMTEPLYLILVRPQRECCEWFWKYFKDIEIPERIQKQVIKMIKGLEGKAYEKRLKELDMFR